MDLRPTASSPAPFGTPLERASFSMYLRYSSEGRGSDAVQFASSKGGLQHIARIHGTLGLAGAHMVCINR